MGIVLWYPIPFTRIPIRLARALGNHTAKYRWFAALYLFLCFLVFPLSVFGLSLAGWQVLAGVGVPFVVLVLFIIIVNLMQSRCPRFLPGFLRTWDFLPRPLHSMKPWDRMVTSAFGFCRRRCCCCCKRCKCCCGDDQEVGGDDGMSGKMKALEGRDNPALSRDEEEGPRQKGTEL